MRAPGLSWLLLALAAVPANAAVTDYVGHNIVEVHLRSNGQDVREPVLTEIVETRPGTPLAMIEVRETLAHLYGLGRYSDIQVDASLRGDGVVLTYNLVPALRVSRIVFEGTPGISVGELRRIVVDRYGASPPLTRAPQVVSTLQTLYRDHGYPRAQIAVRSAVERDPGLASLVFSIEAGPRARLGAVEVQGSPGVTPADLLTRLDVRTGAEYDGIALDAKLDKYTDDLRAEGYYEARAAQLPRYVNDDSIVNLVVTVDPGPHVEIVFQGDPLTAREREELVPIAREHSVDEDLLEDSKFGIERYFRQQGFCNPRADYRRNASGSVLKIEFSVSRGPQCVLDRIEVSGNNSIPSAELAALVRAKTGAPFSDLTVAADASRIQGLYQQRGFPNVKVTPQIDRGETQAAVASVRVRLEIVEGVRSVIRSVTFDGSAAVDDATLRRVIASAPERPYFEPQIASDADQLGLLYLNRGYQEVSVRPVPRFSPDRTSVDLSFAIHEGPQILVDHVLIIGNVRTKTETLAREIQFKGGQPLSLQDEDETRSRLTALGLFRRVEISYLHLPAAATHRDIVITVEEAPVTSIGYGGGLEGGKRLTRSTETGEAIERFEVAPRGFFQIGRRNLFGKDRSVNLFTRVSFRPRGTSVSQTSSLLVENGGYGFNEFLARLSYGERRIFGTPADATLSGGVEQAVRSSFNFNRRSASATLARRVSRALAVSGRYTIDRTRLFDVNLNPADKPLIDRLFPQVRLSAVAASLIRDTRNDAIEPGEGGLIGLDGELAGRRIGSEVGFFKTFLQGFAYRRLGSRGAIGAFGARLGLATGFPRTIVTTNSQGQTVTQVVDDLPASERFYAGGDTTVRGFALDRLGTPATIDPDNFPKGGHGLLILNAELRAPLRGRWGAVGFLDTGNVFLHVDDMSLGALRATAGFGLRYRSPVGPIRADVGIKLDRRILPNGTRERPTALHISLGQAF